MQEKLQKLQQLREALKQQITQMKTERSEAQSRVEQLTESIQRTSGRIFELDEVLEFLGVEEQDADESPADTDSEQYNY